MVRIDFPPIQGDSIRLQVSGHSGRDAKGNDLVCAAVSSLVLTMVGGVECGGVAEVSGSLDEGECDVTMVAKAGKASTLASVAEVFRFGFHRIAETYPEAVRMN